jgi:hypothetical protein
MWEKHAELSNHEVFSAGPRVRWLKLSHRLPSPQFFRAFSIDYKNAATIAGKGFRTGVHPVLHTSSTDGAMNRRNISRRPIKREGKISEA